MSDSDIYDDKELFVEDVVCKSLLQENIDILDEVLKYKDNMEESKDAIDNLDDEKREKVCKNFICSILLCLNDKRLNTSGKLFDDNEGFYFEHRYHIAIYVIFISCNFTKLIDPQEIIPTQNIPSNDPKFNLNFELGNIMDFLLNDSDNQRKTLYSNLINADLNKAGFYHKDSKLIDIIIHFFESYTDVINHTDRIIGLEYYLLNQGFYSMKEYIVTLVKLQNGFSNLEDDIEKQYDMFINRISERYYNQLANSGAEDCSSNLINILQTFFLMELDEFFIRLQQVKSNTSQQSNLPPSVFNWQHSPLRRATTTSTTESYPTGPPTQGSQDLYSSPGSVGTNINDKQKLTASSESYDKLQDLEKNSLEEIIPHRIEKNFDWDKENSKYFKEFKKKEKKVFGTEDDKEELKKRYEIINKLLEKETVPDQLETIDEQSNEDYDTSGEDDTPELKKRKRGGTNDLRGIFAGEDDDSSDFNIEIGSSLQKITIKDDSNSIFNSFLIAFEIENGDFNKKVEELRSNVSEQIIKFRDVLIYLKNNNEKDNDILFDLNESYELYKNNNQYGKLKLATQILLIHAIKNIFSLDLTKNNSMIQKAGQLKEYLHDFLIDFLKIISSSPNMSFGGRGFFTMDTLINNLQIYSIKIKNEMYFGDDICLMILGKNYKVNIYKHLFIHTINEGETLPFFTNLNEGIYEKSINIFVDNSDDNYDYFVPFVKENDIQEGKKLAEKYSCNVENQSEYSNYTTDEDSKSSSSKSQSISDKLSSVQGKKYAEEFKRTKKVPDKEILKYFPNQDKSLESKTNNKNHVGIGRVKEIRNDKITIIDLTDETDETDESSKSSSSSSSSSSNSSETTIYEYDIISVYTKGSEKSKNEVELNKKRPGDIKIEENDLISFNKPEEDYGAFVSKNYKTAKEFLEQNNNEYQYEKKQRSLNTGLGTPFKDKPAKGKSSVSGTSATNISTLTQSTKLAFNNITSVVKEIRDPASNYKNQLVENIGKHIKEHTKDLNSNDPKSMYNPEYEPDDNKVNEEDRGLKKFLHKNVSSVMKENNPPIDINNLENIDDKDVKELAADIIRKKNESVIQKNFKNKDKSVNLTNNIENSKSIIYKKYLDEIFDKNVITKQQDQDDQRTLNSFRVPSLKFFTGSKKYINERTGFEYDLQECHTAERNLVLHNLLGKLIKFDLDDIKGNKEELKQKINEIIHQLTNDKMQGLDIDFETLLSDYLEKDIDLRKLVSSFNGSDIAQFEHAWGKDLSDKIKKSDGKYKCYQCCLPIQKSEEWKGNYSPEMEHKIPLTQFNQTVPSLKYFPTELSYWKTFVKTTHKIFKINDFEDYKLDGKLFPTFNDDLKKEKNMYFRDYMYKAINEVMVDTEEKYKEWSKKINSMLDFFINRFEDFLKHSIISGLRSKNKKQKEKFKEQAKIFNESFIEMNKGADDLSTLFSTNSGIQIKNKLFKWTIKMSLYEFAYSHIYCNQLKIAGNFKDNKVVNGYLQKCFKCCDTTKQQLLKPGSQKKTQLMIVEYGKDETNSDKVASKGIPGGMSDWEKINANEYNQLLNIYGGDKYDNNYKSLYSHLNNVFKYFNEIEKSIGETAISIYKPKQANTLSGMIQKPKITLSLEMIYFYNITKMAASLHNQFYYNLNKKLFDKQGKAKSDLKKYLQKFAQKITKKRKRESRGGTKNITRKNKKLVKKYLIEY